MGENLYGIFQYKLVQITLWDLLSIAAMECIARIPTIPLKFDNIVDRDLYECINTTITVFYQSNFYSVLYIYIYMGCCYSHSAIFIVYIIHTDMVKDTP